MGEVPVDEIHTSCILHGVVIREFWRVLNASAEVSMFLERQGKVCQGLVTSRPDVKSE